MIKYKCDSCGAKLETDDSLSGKSEACPVCRTINPVPLSKWDLDEQQRSEAEKLHERAQQAEKLRSLRQEKELEAKKREAKKLQLEKELQPKKQGNTEEALQQPARLTQQKAEQVEKPQSGPTEPSVTESVFGILGGLCVAIGVTAGLILVIVAVVDENPMSLLFALAAVVGGFLLGVPYFAAQLVLGYLRRITNAVERWE